MFAPVGDRKTLTQQVEFELTEAIRAGKYLPGNKIPTENDLCKMFKVSRTAIREAVKKMSAKGIVEVKRGSGVYVSEMSIKNASEILNIFFELSTNEDVILQTINARLILEPAIAAQAAKYRNDQDVELLKKNMIAMRSCDLNDKKRETELDNDFHRTLLSITNNTVLDLLLSPIFNLMPKFKSIVYAKPTYGNILKDKEIMLEHHENILQAIISQNSDKASEAMKVHIIETQTNYSKSVQKQ
ncbi:FadR/GntR family transcriptional regulator [Arenibacter palladensis]|uniref:FadR/GntR family transcriptional regulator n=1 Tax=Arenibacter palladensis TaxID=237373 RepID=UPI0026E25586|nr:FadR/GntR family transcriptional regulator [Arenibacter palladensis]MDO6602864.1 FadR/GntR family transcriptional regulator [Arenibacter palladensis]